MRRGTLLMLAGVLALMQPTARAEGHVDSRAAFEHLKSLVGTWSITEQRNPKVSESVTYSMTGNGSVLMEHFQGATSAMGHMLTAYHLDVDRLVLTHFCGAGNQPRMRLTAVEDEGRRITFEMYDITNLADPKAYHSTRVDVVFAGDDRVDLVYGGVAGDRHTEQVFQLTRRKS